ncbi:MAG: purine-nucleoside phosphorylase [Coriobacteriales bacterium]|nr:purine-nucleoside phosphorylase [Coriobacteriales bacterium]
MSTPHNAAQPGDIAKVVLMPGDPLRAQVIAERYLENVSCFNEVRNMLGFTGTYHGVPVSVMGSGMGIPSISIYAWELYNHYNVDTIIRVGSTGGLAPQVGLRDIVFAQGACTDSNAAMHYKLPGTYAPIANFDLLRAGVEEAEKLGAPYHVGNVVSTDIFYCEQSVNETWANMGVLAVEMEAAGLYLVAAEAHKRALALMTVSDLPLTGEGLSAQDRQTSFTQMMEVALAVAEREYADKSI